MKVFQSDQSQGAPSVMSRKDGRNDITEGAPSVGFRFDLLQRLETESSVRGSSPQALPGSELLSTAEEHVHQT